jgi:hypothetical protein
MRTICPCGPVRVEEFIIVLPSAENFSKRTIDTSPFTLLILSTDWNVWSSRRRVDRVRELARR